MVNTPWVKPILCFTYMHKYLLLLWPMLFFYCPLNTFSWFHCKFACVDIRLNIFANLHLFKHIYYHTISFTSFYQFMYIHEIKCAWFKCMLRHEALSWLWKHVLQKLEPCPTQFDILSMFYHSYMWYFVTIKHYFCHHNITSYVKFHVNHYSKLLGLPLHSHLTHLIQYLWWVGFSWILWIN